MPLIRLLLGLLVLLTYRQNAIAQAPSLLPHQGCGRLHTAPAAKQAYNEPVYTYQPRHLLLELWLTPDTPLVQGRATYRFTPQHTGAQQLRWELAGSLNVSAVVANGASLGFIHQGDSLLVAWPGGTGVQSLRIDYQGRVGSSGFGSFRTDSAARTLSTLSEPYGASDWFPAYNSLSTKLDSVDLLLHTPPDVQAIANGRRLSHTTSASEQLAHWRHVYPIATYLIGISAGPMVQMLVPSSLPYTLTNWPMPADTAACRSTDNALRFFMNWMRDHLNEYPFPNDGYSQMQFDWGGGMEHQSCTSIGTWGEELVVHELAHQWFGDLITCGSWHDLWLNEGWATYMTGIWYENVHHDTWWPVWKQLSQDWVLEEPGGSVYAYQTGFNDDLFSSRLRYRKGAYVLHQLRWHLGDSLFWQGVRAYLADPALRYGFARTDDFRRHLEDACACNLIPYFDQWVYGEGYPVYDLAWSQNQEGMLRLQTQVQGSLPNSPVFCQKMPLRLIGLNAAGQLDSLDMVQYSFGQTTDTSWHCPLKVLSLKYDPERWVIGKAGVRGLPAEQPLWLAPNPISPQGPLRLWTETTTAQQAVDLELWDTKGALLATSRQWVLGRVLDWWPPLPLATGTYLLRWRQGSQAGTLRVVVR